jgi:hypothetical protein
MSKIIDQLTARFSLNVETIFDGNQLIDFLFIIDNQTDQTLIKVSPNYPTEKSKNSIFGTTSEEKFFFIDINNGKLTIIDQTISGHELINERFIEISGSESCLLFDTIKSKIIDTTIDGYIQLDGDIVKCISSNHTKIYDSKTGILKSTIPNI